jgi:speckle-type POZ protein
MEVQEVVVMAQHLLEAADRYDMTRLKLICEEKLCNYLEVSMVAATMVLAEQHNCQGLNDACIEFLKSPGIQEDVMETDGFDHLTKTSPALVKELMSKLATPGYKRRKLETCMKTRF